MEETSGRAGSQGDFKGFWDWKEDPYRPKIREVSRESVQNELSYEDAMRVLGYKPGALVSPHLPHFNKVAAKLEALVSSPRDERLRESFRDELNRLAGALRVVGGER